MNTALLNLYQRIESFSLDEPDTNLPFSKRLARDNGWTANDTQRVIAEYKKFAFLAVVAGHPVTPSDRVDQVWHLHLVYTHSYWGEFCPNVLGKPLHHGPTRGGKREHQKFTDWYNKTLASYEHFFGQKPPEDIWPPAHIRLGRDVHFQRVNTHQNWILPKPDLLQIRRDLEQLPKPQLAIALLVLAAALTITGCQPSILASLPNPLDFKGPEFLIFYILVTIVAVWLTGFLRSCLRNSNHNYSQNLPDLSLDEIKYLAENFNEVTLDSVHIRNRLHNLGLLVNTTKIAIAQLCVLPIALVLLLGITKIVVGISRGKPVGFLVILCIITALICYGFWLAKPHRTPYGDRVLEQLRSRIKPEITYPQTSTRIVGGVSSPRSGGGDGGGDSGDSGGCGGDGCGGDGCGGCGCGGCGD